MPRGRKKMEKITLEEQLALVDKEIEATESSLKNLRLKNSKRMNFIDWFRTQVRVWKKL